MVIAINAIVDRTARTMCEYGVPAAPHDHVLYYHYSWHKFLPLECVPPDQLKMAADSVPPNIIARLAQLLIPQLRSAWCSRFFSAFSIRGSGINQSSATNTYSALAIQELTNASGIAAR